MQTARAFHSDRFTEPSPHESVSQTLAGRRAFLRLYPMSLSELHGRPPLAPCVSTGLDVRKRSPKGRLPSKCLWDTLLDGFYPRIHDRSIPAGEWLADYVRAYVNRALREVMQTADQRSFERFVRLAAAHTAQELNLSTLAAATSGSRSRPRSVG